MCVFGGVAGPAGLRTGLANTDTMHALIRFSDGEAIGKLPHQSKTASSGREWQRDAGEGGFTKNYVVRCI